MNSHPEAADIFTIPVSFQSAMHNGCASFTTVASSMGLHSQEIVDGMSDITNAVTNSSTVMVDSLAGASSAIVSAVMVDKGDAAKSLSNAQKAAANMGNSVNAMAKYLIFGRKSSDINEDRENYEQYKFITPKSNSISCQPQQNFTTSSSLNQDAETSDCTIDSPRSASVAELMMVESVDFDGSSTIEGANSTDTSRYEYI
jgi:hypothetical protein